jgi:hypothetical protein
MKGIPAQVLELWHTGLSRAQIVKKVGHGAAEAYDYLRWRGDIGEGYTLREIIKKERADSSGVKSTINSNNIS